MNKTETLDTHLGIAAVERDTGLPKDTLRVWERRYGFPQPSRDAHGERLYPREQVDKLRLIRRLLDQGKRPSKIVTASTDELTRMLGEERNDITNAAPGAAQEALLPLLRGHNSPEVRAVLQQILLKQGLQRFVADTVAPLNVAVGDAWLRGEIDVPGEHLYTEQIHNLLRSAIGARTGPLGHPRILLTTFPNEQHSLGLLMVEAMLTPEGAHCVSLGTQTPLADICNTAAAGSFDIVALSFSAAFPARQAVDSLNELRRLLPPRIAVWAGGAAMRGQERKLPDVRVLASLDQTVEALAEWRRAHA
ncbi:MerR family transcriptional regulator [Aromatoleum diolicum]|uniref:MerR family transcriptional regulator n=1 Tax=Aromatoleum diolicum TaxID=75796 RepID=A0ABX1QEN2_9RHOO|nr:MerR family transcriptional regulator [Aromatoleum diolicum]NMG75957.1 MerR family transcriptional regulator [Aromatoleum diolicum]